MAAERLVCGEVILVRTEPIMAEHEGAIHVEQENFESIEKIHRVRSGFRDRDRQALTGRNASLKADRGTSGKRLPVRARDMHRELLWLVAVVSPAPLPL